MSDTVTILVTHQSPGHVHRMLKWWEESVLETDLLVAYGGPIESFSELDAANKIFIEDPRLRTRDHVRERQSYTGIIRAVKTALHNSLYQFVWLVEFDHIPVAANVVMALKQRMRETSADVLCYCLRRIDGTISPHFLGHAKDQAFFDLWHSISVRHDKNVILSMFGSGSLWKRHAFDAVAAQDEVFPVYLEIYLPTMAHHLGFRVVDLGIQNQFIRSVHTPSLTFESAKAEGALTVHPLKYFWESAPPKLGD
jgi:hypothetical protein